MKVVVGLGNPGDEYGVTRHNIGFRVIEAVRRRHGAARERRRGRSMVAEVTIGAVETLVARPLTYMNLSGRAVRDLMADAEAGPGDLLIVCDDLNLDVGAIRVRARGSHGGHNGLRSIIDTLGTDDFPRVRVGVGPAEPGLAHADFVLAPFTRRDLETIETIVETAATCIEVAVTEGLQSAMNRFNRTPRAVPTAGGG